MATWLVERRGNYDELKTCSTFSTQSYVGYKTETCINVVDSKGDDSSFKIRCNVDDTASISKFSEKDCLANRAVSTTKVDTDCDRSSSVTTHFTYTCVNNWDDAFPSNEEVMAHKFHSDTTCDEFIGFSAIKTDTCVVSSGAAIYGDYPKVRTYKKAASSGSFCVSNNIAGQFTIGSSCNCYYTKIPAMLGSAFGTESTAFCGYAVKHTTGTTTSVSVPAIVGIVIGIVALPVFYAILHFMHCFGDKRYSAGGDGRSCFSRKRGLVRVAPDDEDSDREMVARSAPVSASAQTGGPPSPVIQFAIVENDPPIVAQAVVVTNPSPVRNRQFPAATPIPTFTSSEVQMFTDIP